MELELTRVDYNVVGLTLPNTMKLLPVTNIKQQQKVRPIARKKKSSTYYSLRLQSVIKMVSYKYFGLKRKKFK